MHKVRWTGPTNRIPDLAQTVKRGDEFDLDESVILGGEGINFDIIGGDAFDALVADAKDRKISGYTKLTTRLDLEQAVADHDAAEELKAKAEAAEKADSEEEN